MKSSTKDKPWWSIEYEINYSPNWNLFCLFIFCVVIIVFGFIQENRTKAKKSRAKT